MKNRILLISGSFVCLVFLQILLVTSPILAQPPTKVIEWRMVCKQVGPDFDHLAIEPPGIVSRVKEASGGRFILKPYRGQCICLWFTLLLGYTAGYQLLLTPIGSCRGATKRVRKA